MKMKVREPVKGSTKVRGRETMGVTMVVREHGEFARRRDVTVLGECEDDGSRMEKFVDTGACEVLAWCFMVVVLLMSPVLRWPVPPVCVNFFCLRISKLDPERKFATQHRRHQRIQQWLAHSVAEGRKTRSSELGCKEGRTI